MHARLTYCSSIIFNSKVQTYSLFLAVQKQAKDLINAERCSLFLIDKETDELYAKAFDIGATSDELKVKANTEHKLH